MNWLRFQGYAFKGQGQVRTTMEISASEPLNAFEEKLTEIPDALGR